MKSLKSKLSKLAAFVFIGAFSFGLAISCVSNHKQNVNKVFAADDISTRWEYNSNNKALSCTYASNYPNGFIDKTNQVSVTGLGEGQYEVAYNVLGYPSNSVQPDYTDYGTFTLVFISGSYNSTPSSDGPYGSITAYPLDISGLDSNTEYEIYIKVEPTGDMNEQNSGAGTTEPDGTWTLSNGSLSFQFTDWQTNGYVTETNQIMVYGHGDGTFDISYELLGSPPGATTAGTELIAEKTIQLTDGYWTPSETGGYGTVSGYPVDVNGLDSGTMITLNINVQYSGTMNEQGSGEDPIPEPPALSALEWFFDTDMGYFATHLYNDNYYSFSLGTIINSVIFDRVNFTVTAHCTVTALEGNMPEEYYEAEMTFDYTFESGGLVENTWRFYNAVCEDTVEETESIYFSPDVVSFRELGWYFDEDLRYYVEEGITASWNIIHAEYRTEGSRNELVLYMDVEYDGEHTYDVIQINNPNFDEAPYRGQLTLGTGVYGWSDKLQQNISIPCNYVPFGYYADGWSYDSYSNELVYINASDIDMKYHLTSASSNQDSYLLTYTCDGDSQSIYVTEAVYEDEILSGEVELVENSDPVTVTISVPQSIIDGGTTSTYEYHICFDGNGATGGSMDDDVFTKDSYSYDYPLPDCGYEKDGYTFDGWATVAVDPVIKFQPGQTSNVRSVTEENPTYTFYATWKKTNFTITFYPNGGSGTMEPITVANGAREVVPYCEFYYPGYEFVCWAVGSPTSSMKVTPDGQYSVTVTQDYDLYAVWEATGSVQHEGMWYDEDLHKLRFYNTDIDGGVELPVELEVVVLDYGPNTSLTRASINAYVYYEGEVWDMYSYEMRTFEVGVENSKKFISGQIDVDYDQRYEQVKLYPEIFYNNVFKPGQLNYVEGYNQIYYVNDSYDSAVVEPEVVEFNEITRVFRIEAYAVDVTGEEDLIEFTFELTEGVVLEGDLNQDAQVIEGYFAELGRRIKLNVFNIGYNSLEEESITPETIEDITNAMDTVELSPDQINQINQKIEDNKEQIPDSTGGKIADALTNTAPTLSDDPEVLEAQKDVIVAVVETVIEVETNKPSDIGQSVRTDSSLPANAGISIEQEVREFYELQMANLIGEEKTNRRGIFRAPTATDYKIDVSGKTVEELNKDLDDYGNMTDFIDDSVQNMNTAGRKLRACSGQAMKVEVKRTVVKIKTSSFRDFDKDAADLQFAYDVHNAMMLHLQEVVVTELEKDYKPSGNKEKDEQYQQELAACKDIESFTEIVIEVLRQKYNAITDSNVEYDDFVQIDDEGKYKGIYWDIFEAWCLDKPCPYPITFQELTDATVDTTTQNARSFELNTEVTNTEVVFTAAFVGGGVAFISLAGVLGYVLKKRSLKGVSK